MVGLFLFTLGTWSGQCLENQEYSERRSFVLFCFCSSLFQTGVLLWFWFVWLCWVSYLIWEYSYWAVCQASNLDSFLNANFPSWAAIGSWCINGSDVALNTTHLQLYCYLWQFKEKSLTKSSKFSLKKSPVMSVPDLNSPLYTLSLTASLTCLMWLGSLCRW